MGDCDSAIISCLPDRPVGRLTGSPKAIAMMQRGNWRVVARRLLTSVSSYFRSRDKPGVVMPSPNVVIETRWSAAVSKE
jgi:hypothetical protein